MAETKGRILVVEDDVLISMLLEDMLADLAYEVCATAATLEEALTKARSISFDAAILDVSLGGVNSMPVADVLDEKGTPFLFATGYDTLPDGINGEGRHVLQKPYQLRELEAALARLNIKP